jgi:acetyl-CoA acetyltransferase
MSAGPEAVHRDKLARGSFEIQRCAACARHVFYPRVLCPWCGSDRLAWVSAAGTGTVYSTTIVRRKPADGGDYNVALVDLDAATESGGRAFAMAGLKPADVDVLELYDAFTINTILFLEDLGFCAKGEGGPFVSGGRIAPGGALPVNTNGGGLSCVHPGMYGIFLVVQAVRQLRGEAGARQVKGASVALVHGNGGVLSSQVTATFGTEKVL